MTGMAGANRSGKGVGLLSGDERGEKREMATSMEEKKGQDERTRSRIPGAEEEVDVQSRERSRREEVDVGVLPGEKPASSQRAPLPVWPHGPAAAVRIGRNLRYEGRGEDLVWERRRPGQDSRMAIHLTARSRRKRAPMTPRW